MTKLRIQVSLAAILIGGLVFASSAAAQAEFRSAGYPATVSIAGTTTVVLKTHEGTLKCQKTTATGSLSEPATELAVTPAFSECTFAGLKATVESTGKFVLKADGGMQFQAGTKVVVSALSCTITIAEQTRPEGLTYSNQEPGFTITASVSGISYSATTGCPSGGGSFKDGVYTGSSKATGNNGNVVVAKTTLCTDRPVLGVCPVGKTFATKDLIGTLPQDGSSVSWVSTGGTLGTVTCTESTFSLKLEANGTSSAPGGISTLTFHNKILEDCSSTLGGGTPKVEVVSENLSYEATTATYLKEAEPQGAFAIANKAAANKVQIKFTIHYPAPTGDVVCRYQPFSGWEGRWFNGVALSSEIEFSNQAFAKTAGGASCPGPISFNGRYKIVRGAGAGEIYLAS